MRVRSLLAAAAALSALSGAGAQAADFGRNGAPYYGSLPRDYDWSGFYVGANAGYQWGGVDRLPHHPSGFFIGAQGGRNWQFGQFVVGAEADLQFSGADDDAGGAVFANRWHGTLRGRAGYALNNLLIYGTGGLAVGGGRLSVAGIDDSRTHVGLAAGAGLEVGLNRAWTARAEVLYVGFASEPYRPTGLEHGMDAALLRMGFNFRF